MNKRVLVTGGTGFIGRWAVEELVARGYEVHVCGRHDRADVTHSVQLHEANLLAAGIGERLLGDIAPTHLLHLAWETAPVTYWTSHSNLTWAASTLNLVRAAVSAGCGRVVGVGTCAEYDWTEGGILNELRSPLAPASLYGAAKAATFRLIQAFSTNSKTSFAWARIFYQYGLYEHPKRLVPYVIRAVLDGTPAECSHGEQLRDFLYSADVGYALAALLDSGVEGPVNIGSGQIVRLRELICETAELAGDGSLVRLGARNAPKGEPLVLIPSVVRLREEVGWKPRFSLTEGLTRCIEFWRAAR